MRAVGPHTLRPGAARRVVVNDRPIASELPLANEHVARIDESHERCAALGVSRIGRLDFSTIGQPDLIVARERNLRLHQHAAPVMEMLYDQIINTQSMVVLTDATGTILHSFGDDDFLGRAAKVALAPGANWSESAKGTNAVGTALVSEVPTLVHADEHYLHANHFLTCSAAPILDPRGNILGVLDVSGDRHSYHQHTMALVKMSARMIENHWLTDDYRNVMRVHFHGRAEFIGTLMEGILAVGPDGRLVGANRGALEQLGLSGAALRMQSLESLFGTSVDALVDRFRSPLATPMPVNSQGQRRFHLHARFNWPVWSSLADAVTLAPAMAAAQTETPSASTEAPVMPEHLPEPFESTVGLAQLRTGDGQMNSVLDKVSRVVDRGIAILILGETGTGKQVLAQAIHNDSARARQPFVAVNCAAIAPAMLEAELWGYQDGAFNGARRKGAVGKIVQANGGTLFLDDIGELPLPLQAQLLRVLNERQVRPMGDNKSVSVDVALICASPPNLHARMLARGFREDLYYRLNGLAVRLPRLCERGDLLTLVRHILDAQEPGRHLPLNADVQRLFEHYNWPGNIRQLTNVLRTASVMAAGQSAIAREHLSDDWLDDAQHCLTQAQAAGATAAAALPTGPTGPVAASGQSLDELEIAAIQRAVAQANGNISQASRQLGVSRTTIYRKLRWNAKA